MVTTFADDLKGFLVDELGFDGPDLEKRGWHRTAAEAMENGDLPPEVIAEKIELKGDDADKFVKWVGERLGKPKAEPPKRKGPSRSDVFGNVRLKAPSERYSREKSAGTHRKTGQPVHDEHGRPAMLPSELEYAKAGALFKQTAFRAGIREAALSDHERDLIEETYERDTWCGKLGSEYVTGLPGSRVKALLSDSTSGGQELVPVWFDANVIQFPLLHSELLPFVDLVPVPRGSSVEGASVSNPTLIWGTAEGSALTPFTTDSLVGELNTDIYPVTVAVEIGRDFMADAAVDIGRVLLENIGQRYASEYDKVIANGNGSTQPEGIFQAAGVTDIGDPAGGAGAVPQVDDYEALIFGVDKQYRRPGFNPVLIGNDTTYMRARAIAVGAADERRVFGMDHQSYQLLEHPFKIQNDLANTVCAFGCLKRYRFYRRMAQEVQWTTEGRTLALSNLALLVVRSRVGGRVMDTNAFCKSDSWQA